MQIVINVKGTKLSVVNIFYRTTGEPSGVYALDENGRQSLFIDKKQSQHDTRPHIAVENLSEMLEYPELEARIVEGNNRLIKHLEDMQKEENSKLLDIAIDAMESEPGLPFDSHLSSKQHEYKLLQQRVFGIIDTVEEVKAFTEGYYTNVDDETVTA
ncbi:hypothetical protein FC756_26975 [Lysinibacillus mangiferihumi]|uniref:Uncharacterized protein n=1 Tax=Lysinibacillus mangiferihumi TaxID=1130819 RepID=A0A4U2Y1D6_9BACI|nr:hypothetical protein [Lysinibacillus mangiferihumi]TKI52851.1 hypothetical protein FC756_26975 [Lysinibacillus mangiferihumi]